MERRVNVTLRLLVVVALLALTVGTAAAQDAKAVLQAAAAVMGANNLKTIRISGTGFVAGVGHSYTSKDDWPRTQVTSYTRMIDYDAKSSREELTTRSAGDYRDYPGRRVTDVDPPRDGLMPREGRQVSIVSGNYAWTVDGKGNPRPPFRGYLYAAVPQAELWQLDIVLTPHGFLKAAMAGNATATLVTLVGVSNGGTMHAVRRATIVSFTALGKYRVNGTINDQNLVEVVQTWVANPVVGDMLYETVMTDYKDFGGVKFPTVLRSHQGDGRLNAGENAKEIRVNDVKANVSVPAIKIPDLDWQGALVRTNYAESEKVADGVWRIKGGTHYSVAVEFRDFAAVIEAPMNEERSLAVIGEVTKLMPNKPIRYLVQPHHHWEHSGGRRTYAAMGTTIVTHEGNREFFENVVLSPAPRMMEPDRFSTLLPYFGPGRRPRIETTKSKYVLSDGVRTLDVYAVDGFSHGGHMLIVYLPKEKSLVNSDLYSPAYIAGGGTIEQRPTHAMVELYQTIQQLKLDVDRHVAMHGTIGTMDEFVKILKSGTPGPDDY